MPAMAGGTTLESSPTEEGSGDPVCTVELSFLGPVPAGPRFPGAGCVAIDTVGMGETDGVGAASLRVVMLSVSQVHHAGQATG